MRLMNQPQPTTPAAPAEGIGRVLLKGPSEQAAMRVAGRLAADVLDMIGTQVVPGITTDELDRLCHEYIVNVQQAVPAPLGYRGFPKSICTSINHVVCHGIPGDKRLKQGDIVNVSDRSYNKIFVLGEVTKPGSLVMNKKRSTLAEALSDAGYINQTTADPRWIYVMRGDTEEPQLYHLDSRAPDAMLLADRFPLRPRDIVYVDTAPVVRWQRVIANILPTATMLNLTSQTYYPLFGGRQPSR